MQSVSVVIPAYNPGPYLAEAVESAVSQDPPPLEVIVVPGGRPTPGARPLIGTIRLVWQ